MSITEDMLFVAAIALANGGITEDGALYSWNSTHLYPWPLMKAQKLREIGYTVFERIYGTAISIYTRSDTSLIELRNQLYHNETKCPSSEIIDALQPRHFAYMFMECGAIYSPHAHIIREEDQSQLHKVSAVMPRVGLFLEVRNEWIVENLTGLQRRLAEFNIRVSTTMALSTPTLATYTEQEQYKFLRLIHPYVLPRFHYLFEAFSLYRNREDLWETQISASSADVL